MPSRLLRLQPDRRASVVRLVGRVGSTLGSIVIYIIGYTGGEVLLRKRLSPAALQKIHEFFDRHEFWALIFPAMFGAAARPSNLCWPQPHSKFPGHFLARDSSRTLLTF